MLGALAGDFIGSRFERCPPGMTDFDLIAPSCKFTDDSVLTVATAEALMGDGDFASAYRRWARRYPRAGYGASFFRWAQSDDLGAYQSWGNGGAMRVSPVAYCWEDDGSASAGVTHDHPHGTDGARAVVSAIRLALAGIERGAIERYLRAQYAGLRWKVREFPEMDLRAQTTAPTALLQALSSNSWEDAIRRSVALGGDVDTVACMAGALAEALYGGVPPEIAAQVESQLPDDMRTVYDGFNVRWGRPGRGGPISGPQIPPELREIYEATVIEIESPDGRLVLSCSDPAPQILLPESWVITGCNPRSEPIDDAANRGRNRALEEIITASGFPWYPAVGRDRNGQWSEESFSVVGTPRELVLRWGRCLGQLGVFRVGGETNGVEVVGCWE